MLCPKCGGILQDFRDRLKSKCLKCGYSVINEDQIIYKKTINNVVKESIK